MDTIDRPLLLFYAFACIVPAGLLVLSGVISVVQARREWRRNREEREEAERRKCAALAELTALDERLNQQAQPQIYYLPLGRLPALPPIMALPPYEAPMLPGLPTYPGDLPVLPDLYPLYEQEFDATVLAALERIGEW